MAPLPVEDKESTDLATQANPTVVAQKHFSIELTTDFQARTLVGHVVVEAEIRDAAQAITQGFVLDTNNIDVAKVTFLPSATPNDEVALAFELGDKHAAFGRALKIDLSTIGISSDTPPGTRIKVKIAYNTTPAGAAMQWLPPAQTAGKVHPYLFTQCQAIHARSFLPCQDTPQVKVTYDAKITVPKDLVAIMSALGNGDAAVGISREGNMHTFAFKQPVTMASYLIALAVGDLATRSVGERCGVWAEPAVVDAAAYEFADMEVMLKTGEEVCGPYVWGRYDVLCMPPSFPYGGMENPCLTFVTPTLLAGDRSLADVVVHEITHSWTGNLVTNRTWRHFWLNEGWTMFVQRKIVEKLHSTAIADLTAVNGLEALRDSVQQYGETHNFTALLPTLDNVDPDDAFSSVPYEKGFNLLRYLETDFFTNYFKQQSIDTSVVDWDTWLNAPGMPPVENTFDDSMLVAARALKTKWLTTPDATSTDDLQGWHNGQILLFLDMLQQEECKTQMTEDLLNAMNAHYKFTDSRNAEVRFRWQMLCVKAEMASILPHAIKLITEQGRMKFTRPLYRTLFASKVGKQAAVDTFKAHRDEYHPICSKMLARDLELD
eukprot:m.576719 g.576719  ORF g.576719 m.576719 type:complete len:604 (+) comp22287_c1_seq2:96-1907(+)